MGIGASTGQGPRAGKLISHLISGRLDLRKENMGHWGCGVMEAKTDAHRRPYLLEQIVGRSWWW